MTIGGLSGFMDELAAQSRSTRDTAFNALDAVNRDSRRAGAELGARVAARVAEQQARQAATGHEPQHSDPTDADPNRFAPEDEWELAAPQAPAPPAEARTTSPSTPSRAADDDDDDYPATWLR